MNRILTKEKIDRQVAGQSSSTPFMSIKDIYISNKRVTFDMQDGLEEKIGRLMVMMSKLTAKDEGTNRQFKPKIFQSKGRARQVISMTDITMMREIIRIGIDQIVEIREFHLVVELSVDKIIEIDQGMNKSIGMTLKEEILEGR